ncbi:hypothetical protein BHE74_00018183 [Ensete ventricosum]|nr:hypothetical protein GW17_00045293 [Ensete ventricosum]RWW73913.1 hypothetical protein BHE74_00018183 [Ensete ventricosum]
MAPNHPNKQTVLPAMTKSTLYFEHKSFLARFAFPGGKAPYRAVRTNPPTDRYVDHPLPGGTAEIDRKSTVNSRFRPSTVDFDWY